MSALVMKRLGIIEKAGNLTYMGRVLTINTLGLIMVRHKDGREIGPFPNMTRTLDAIRTASALGAA